MRPKSEHRSHYDLWNHIKGRQTAKRLAPKTCHAHGCELTHNDREPALLQQTGPTGQGLGAVAAVSAVLN